MSVIFNESILREYIRVNKILIQEEYIQAILNTGVASNLEFDVSNVNFIVEKLSQTLIQGVN